MGADGSIQVLRLSDWTDQYPDLEPETIGLKRRSILGVDVVVRYHDTDERDDFDNGWPSVGYPAAVISSLRSIGHRLDRIENPLPDDMVTGEPGFRVLDRYPLAPMVESTLLSERERLLAMGADLELGQRILDAQRWFEECAEEIEVWT